MKNLSGSGGWFYRRQVIVIAEDNETQAEIIRRYLRREGHSTVAVRDGWAAIDAVRRHRPALIVLDVMMPGIDGLAVCRTLRRESDVLILMLTARSTENDLLIGLEAGADDYMTKPYSPRELTARIRTLLRRAGRFDASAAGVLRVGGLTVDPLARDVRAGCSTVELTRGEFEILAVMAAHPGRVFTRRQLLEATSETDRPTSERAIDVHVRNLRKKIETDPARPALLLTVFGVGYKISNIRAGQGDDA
jgi:DNA-binding response OmpR family regulator